MARSGSGAKRLASAMASEGQISFEDAYRSVNESEDYDDEEAPPIDIRMVLMWDGNVAELIDDHELEEIGRAVVREFDIDYADRKDWIETARIAQEAAAQKPPGKKNTPFEGASNVKYPLLTTSCIQFASRALPALIRSDEVIEAKVLGQDDDGQKAKRAQRSGEFANDQLLYRCTEWEPGTDALLHALPCIGAGFRKCYWDAALNRPRMEYVVATDVIVACDAPSVADAPRITHILKKYPYEIEKLTRGENPMWLPCEYQRDTTDSQKREEFLEQCRYLDLDEDGLSEPYVVTVHRDTKKVVRIDPAFDPEDVIQDQSGQIVSINRMLPWVDYTFIPHPEGGAYGIGFGQLLASLSDVIDTTINELLDAGHLANTNTGFVSSAVKTRSGEIDMRMNTFKTLPGVMDVKNAIYRMEFPGPNQTLFNLLEFLIGTAKDITSVKDVLTGDAPGQQPATSTLALIEQGLQVFSAIYKRIYRSMTREFELLYRLNARYLSQEEYQRFLDARPPEQEVNTQAPGIGHNGGPPMSAADMGNPPPTAMPSTPGGAVIPFPGASPPANGMGGQFQDQAAPGAFMGAAPDVAGPQAFLPGAPQAAPPQQPPQNGAPIQGGGPPPGLQQAIAGQLPQPQQQITPAHDFNLEDMDIRPVADPTAVTEMQRLARAQFIGQVQQMYGPVSNLVEGAKRMYEAGRVPDIDKLVIESNPLMEMQAQAQAASAQAMAEAAQWDAKLKQAQAAAAELEPQLRQMELGIQQGQLQVQQADIQLKSQQAESAYLQAQIDGQRLQKEMSDQQIAEHTAAMDEVERGMRLELDERRQRSDEDRNTIDKLKMVADRQLTREQMRQELRRILAEAEDKRATREQSAKDAEAERKLKASEGEKDRELEREKFKVDERMREKDIEAKKEMAKEAAKARAQQAANKPKPK